MCVFSPIPKQNNPDGCGGSWYSTQIWYAFIKIWGAKLQGSLQLDMSYATISVFGKPKRLYRETLMKYVVSSEEKPRNFHIYSIHSDMDSYILFNADMCPSTNDKPLALHQELCINEESVDQNQELLK